MCVKVGKAVMGKEMGWKPPGHSRPGRSNALQLLTGMGEVHRKPVQNYCRQASASLKPARVVSQLVDRI